MKSLRNLVTYCLALALAAFAMPGLAQQPSKIYSMTVSPLGSAVVEVKVTNETPTGNSTIKSFVITPPPEATITLLNPPATRDGAAVPATVAMCGSNICVNGFEGLKSGNKDPYYMSIRLGVSYGSGLACGASRTWRATVYTGNSFAQEEFNQVDATTKQTLPGNPGVTQTNVCGYKVEITPGSVAKGSSPTLNAKVTNVSATPITQVTLNPPVSGGISITTNTFDQSIGTTPVDISLAANVTCNATGGQWSTSVLPNGFAKTAADTTTTVYGACDLVFSSLPKSIVPGEPFNVVVKLVDGDGATIPGFGGTVTLTATGSGCTLASAGSQTTASGVVSINGVELALTSETSCKLQAKATYDNVDFTKESSPLKVFTGVLSCALKAFNALTIPGYLPDDPSTFNASPENATPPVDGSEDTAFLAGARGRGDVTKDNCSADINFAVVNNIPDGSVARQDPLGNVVPDGAWSFTWDEQIAPNPVIGVITTYRSEWGDPVTGLPTNSTWICKTRPCPGSRALYPNDWKKLESCLGTAVTHASVPDGEAACLVQEIWTVLDVGDAAYCTTPPPSKPSTAPAGWQPRCLQPTAISIIGQDPVFIR